MAKLTTLELYNRVLEKIGEPVVTSMVSLSGRKLMAFNCLQEAQKEIYTENSIRWKFAEGTGTMVMTAGTSSYAFPSDMIEENIYTVRCEDTETNIEFMDHEEFDNEYPKVTSTGMPTAYTKFNDYACFNAIPDAGQVGYVVRFRYWKTPTAIASNTAGTATGGTYTATTGIPEMFEESVLVNLAVYKMFKYEGDGEVKAVYIELYGDGNKEGSFAKMKRIYGSNKFKEIRVDYEF